MNMQFQSSEILCQNFHHHFPQKAQLTRLPWLWSHLWILAAKGVRIQDWDLLPLPGSEPGDLTQAEARAPAPGEENLNRREEKLPAPEMELAANVAQASTIKTLQ